MRDSRRATTDTRMWTRRRRCVVNSTHRRKLVSTARDSALVNVQQARSQTLIEWYSTYSTDSECFAGGSGHLPEDKPPGCQPSRSCSLPRPQHTKRDAAPQGRGNLRLPASLPTGVGPVRTQRPHPLHQASPDPVLLALHKQLPGLDGSPRPVEPRGEGGKASARGVCGGGGGGDGARGLVGCGGARECMQGCPGKSLARECREGVQVPGNNQPRARSRCKDATESGIIPSNNANRKAHAFPNSSRPVRVLQRATLSLPRQIGGKYSPSTPQCGFWN